MFERFTERARRTLFFARYEASQLGQVSIETEHLLLGILRVHGNLVKDILARANASADTIRRALEQHLSFQQKVSTSVEIPFSAETKRVLQYAALEADALNHTHIGPEHLLLGLLREDKSAAAVTLSAHGVTLKDARQIVEELTTTVSDSERGTSQIDVDAALRQLDRIGQTVSRLVDLLPDTDERRELLSTVHVELETLKHTLGR